MADSIIEVIKDIESSIDDDVNYSRDKTNVYVISSKQNEKYYIGVSKDAEIRKQNHLWHLRKKKHVNKNLQKEFNDGEVLEWTIFTVPSREMALEIERTIITSRADDPNCLNIAQNSSNGYYGRVHSDETKKKMSESAKKSWEQNSIRRFIVSVSTKNYWNNITQEQSKKHSDAAKIVNDKIKENPELREKITKKIKDYWTKPENKKAQSEKRKKFFQNGGINPQTGIPLTEEHKNKLQEGRKNFYNNLTKEEKNELISKKTKHLNKEVIINGHIFPSIAKAAEELGISTSTAGYRVNSEKFENWKFKG